MYEDCLDSITTKIDSVNLFDSITGELVTSFKPEECTITVDTALNTLDTALNTLNNSVPFITFDYKNYESYINNESYIKVINKIIDELNERKEE